MFAAIVCAVTIPYKQFITGPARVESAAIWYVSSPSADEVICGWRRNLLNAKGGQWNMQFERPDVVEILIAEGISEGSAVNSGDTVAWVMSREGAGTVAILEAEVDQAMKMLSALKAGSREQDIELAKQELRRTQIALDTAEVAFTRAKELNDSGYVSTVELQQAEGIVRVLRAEVDVAEANVRAYRAGSRVQDVSVGEAEVERLERELTRAKSLPSNRQPVISPIRGRAHLSDTLGSLITVEKTDTMAIVTWVPETALPAMKKGDRILLRLTADRRTQRVASLLSTEFSSVSSSGAVALGLSANDNEEMKSGMTGEASFSIGRQTFISGALLKLGARGF